MKKWKMPVVMTITRSQLASHIKAAARSGMCWFGDFR